MRRRGLGNYIELSLTVRIILLVLGLVLLVGGIALLEHILILGLVLLGLGVLLAFIGMGSSGNIMHVRRGAQDPRKSETGMKAGGGYQNPWDVIGKGER